MRARITKKKLQKYVDAELAKLSPEAREVLRRMHDDELDRYLGM